VKNKAPTGPAAAAMDITEQIPAITDVEDDDGSLSSSSFNDSGSNRDRELRTTTSPPHSSPTSLKSLNPSTEVIGLKRDAEMIDRQGDGENEDDGISGIKRKPVKSRKLFIEDSDEES
jgi:hypothetical protein